MTCPRERILKKLGLQIEPWKTPTLKGEERERERDWEFGVDMCTLLYLK